MEKTEIETKEEQKKKQIEILKNKINEFLQKKQSWKEKHNCFLEENKTITEEIAQLEIEIETTKNKIIEEEKQEYLIDLKKQRSFGIGIRVTSKLNYDDEEALVWAKEHQLCLTLDTKLFEQVAKTQKLPFVTMNEKIVVTFPKDLQQ